MIMPRVAIQEERIGNYPTPCKHSLKIQIEVKLAINTSTSITVMVFASSTVICSSLGTQVQKERTKSLT